MYVVRKLIISQLMNALIIGYTKINLNNTSKTIVKDMTNVKLMLIISFLKPIKRIIFVALVGDLEKHQVLDSHFLKKKCAHNNILKSISNTVVICQNMLKQTKK